MWKNLNYIIKIYNLNLIYKYVFCFFFFICLKFIMEKSKHIGQYIFKNITCYLRKN